MGLDGRSEEKKEDCKRETFHSEERCHWEIRVVSKVHLLETMNVQLSWQIVVIVVDHVIGRLTLLFTELCGSLGKQTNS